MEKPALTRPTNSGKGRRPNIVLVLLDDMGFSDIGCYGSEISTPNIDALAENGLRFTQFYNTARCCPTRASLLTGLYPHQVGIGHMTGDIGLPAYRGDLSRDCVTIAEALRLAGYRALMSGKWHVTPINGTQSPHNWPFQRGFERHYGTVQGCGSYFDPVTLMQDNRMITPEGDDYYYTDALSDHAVQFITDYAGKGAPFFLYLAYTAPHWPLHARPEDIERHRERYTTGWDVLREQRYERMKAMGLISGQWPLSPRTELATAWNDTRHRDWEAHRMAVYAAMIAAVDRGIGRVMAALRNAGQEASTLVLFLADNGGCAEVLPSTLKASFIPELTRDGRPVRLGNDPSILPGTADTYSTYGPAWANLSNTPFRLFKCWVHEGGIATPLIAHWPGIIEPGSLTHELAHVMDILPTCLDVAGAKCPDIYMERRLQPLEGTSLLPVLDGQTHDRKECIFWEHEGNRVVRAGNLKMVSKFPGPWELYDLEADRTELNDLAGRIPGQVAELNKHYEEWAQRCGVRPWDEIRDMVWIPM